MESKNGEKQLIADLHIHSRFSRACSKDLTIENLEKWARVKGIDILGTGDFTHELWLKEIKEKLKDNGNGIFYSNSGFKFVLTGEISLIYTDVRGRRVHLVLLAPSLGVVEKVNKYLDTKGRRDYDGRPIFKIPSNDFVREMKKIDGRIEIIPGHCMTPWFGVFGSESGFDSLYEAFKEETKHIHAVETGMSASPFMLQQFDFLNDKAIVSFSDSHSFWPWRLGREATIFSEIKSYDDLIMQIRENKILGTIETDPCYGKYHYDGHRLCDFSCSSEESKKLSDICPKCNKKLVIGVENRVEKLKNQTIDKHIHQKKFYKLLPLHELIALALGVGMTTKKAWEVYNEMIKSFGNEFNILLDVSENDLLRVIPKHIKLIELILRNREGKIKVKPGYDGEYGVPLLDFEQKKLF